MAISQQDRLVRIATPLGENTFIVLSFTAIEEISDLFEFQLELASERHDIEFGPLAGKNATVSIASSDGGERCFNGIIVSFSPAEISEKEGYSKYKAVMRPAFWMLSRCHDCRIFQDKSVPDIIRQVLDQASLGPKSIKAKIDYRLDLAGNYGPRNYCVQYNESDHAFISRLCENEGIFYFFEHENGKHTLVFADSPNSHKAFAAGAKETVEFQKTMGGNPGREVITALQPTNRLATAKYTARDYNFTIPDNDLTVQSASGHTGFTAQGEHYEYPGGYDKTNARGQSLAKLRMQADDMQADTLLGRSLCRGFAAGFKYALGKHPIKALNGKAYVLTKVRHQARQNFTAAASGGDDYYNLFCCIPHIVPYRPGRKSDNPLIAGSQTAIVTGPAGEEIHTDEHGRVKVRFHWDRNPENKDDEHRSCWIRVSQSWAGGKWGAMHIPRVGQEVIVNFEDGDPDRPLITGRVYHGKNKPPYDLPAEKTKSTIMSNSSKNGDGNFNEIRFEDLKGSEELFTHAAKDQNEVVENDMTTEVKHDHTVKVQNDRAVIVAKGNENLQVQSGGRQVAVKADEKHTNDADFAQKVGGSYTLKVNGNITIDASGIVKITGAKVIINP